MVMLQKDHITTPDPVHFSLDSVDEEGENVLDANILDDTPDTNMANAPYGQRQEPFSADTAFVAPTHSWHDFAHNHDTMNAMTFTTINDPQNFFPKQVDANYNHQGNPSQAAEYPHHSQSWQQAPFMFGPETQSAPYNTYSQEPNGKGEAPRSNTAVQTPQTSPQTTSEAAPASTSPDYQQQYPTSATSPPSDAGWLSNSSSDPTDQRPKREILSPTFGSNSLQLRRDGVRKKNARFEIPEGRNVETIDKYIASCDPRNEILMKELKQQKRLLRNRQAALDSRSRKKEHTQRLEEQSKLLMANMEQLEEELHQRRMQETRWLHERDQWQHMVNSLVAEKEEMVQRHTLETAELRRKNAYLVEEGQRRSTVPLSAEPSSAGFSTGFSDFDHLSMQDSMQWENFSLVPQSGTEPEMSKRDSTALIVRSKDDKSNPKDEDHSAGSGLLLMLLLFGAYVASRSSSTQAAIPRMSDDVRVASAAVLDNIYQDAGLHPQRVPPPPTNPAMSRTNSYQHPTNPQYQHPSDAYTLHQQLTTPSHGQQRDEIFSLSSTQYNSITSDSGYFDPSQRSSPTSPQRKRRSLSESLAAMRLGRNGPAGEVYTRSLLWDEIPANIVRDFARMVAETNNHHVSGNGAIHHTSPMHGGAEPLS